VLGATGNVKHEASDEEICAMVGGTPGALSLAVPIEASVPDSPLRTDVGGNRERSVNAVECNPLAHVPDHHEILVRYSGAYSVRRRARWRKHGILADTRLRAEPPPPNHDVVPGWPALRARRSRWAELLRRIFEVDPLRCPRCDNEMRILAFILDAQASATILRHLRRHGRDPYSMHQDELVAAGRAPPSARTCTRSCSLRS
jgi:hypothetical protein